jgi:hypothetical protein
MSFLWREKELIESYYATLGLSPGASAEDVRQAFRVRAKTLHPDMNPAIDTAGEFRRLHEAYRILSKGRPSRSGGPARPARDYAEERVEERVERMAPFLCTCCHRPAAQPRFTAFWIVESPLVFAFRRPKAGLFCAACARKTALRASLVSALLGWWSIPGLLVTPRAILANAAGGERPKGSDLSLLWQSSMIFYSRGDFRTSRALAARVAASKHPLAKNAGFLVKRIARENPDCPKVVLRDPWIANRRDWWKHLVLAAGMPAALVTAAYAYQDAIDAQVVRTSARAQNYVDAMFPGKRQDLERRARKILN